MGRYLVDAAVTLAVFFPLFMITLSVLWRLKSRGAYTVLLGIFFEMVFLRVGIALAPQAINYHRGVGMPPVVAGIAMGCGMPMIFMMLYHLAQRRQKKNASKKPWQ